MGERRASSEAGTAAGAMAGGSGGPGCGGGGTAASSAEGPNDVVVTGTPDLRRRGGPGEESPAGGEARPGGRSGGRLEDRFHGVRLLHQVLAHALDRCVVVVGVDAHLGLQDAVRDVLDQPGPWEPPFLEGPQPVLQRTAP